MTFGRPIKDRGPNFALRQASERSKMVAEVGVNLMQGLFNKDAGDFEGGEFQKPRDSSATRVLGFAGSAVICWILLRLLAPFLPTSGVWPLLQNLWVKIGITALVALGMAVVLSRIEGTIWGKYYVTIGHLLSLCLVIWIVLRLLHYV